MYSLQLLYNVILKCNKNNINLKILMTRFLFTIYCDNWFFNDNEYNKNIYVIDESK